MSTKNSNTLRKEIQKMETLERELQEGKPKTIKIDYETWLKLQNLSKKLNVTIKDLLAYAVEVLECFESEECFQKRFWYVFKFIMSYAQYRYAFYDFKQYKNENYVKYQLQKRLEEIESRLKVNAEELRKAIKDLESVNGDGKKLAEINDKIRKFLINLLIP